MTRLIKFTIYFVLLQCFLSNNYLFAAASITQTTAIAFGTFAPSTSGSGTVTITRPNGCPGTDATTVSSGLKKFTNGNSARFRVTGTPNANITVTISDSSATLASGGNSMSISAIVFCNGTPPVKLDGSGIRDVCICGTLSVGNSQAAGTYNTSSNVYVINVTGG